MEDKLQTTGPTSMTKPDFIPTGDHRGTEHITRDDLKIPRIGLAQALSPELKETDVKFIDGLKQGQMFNDLLKKNLGKEIFFHIVRSDPPRWVEFNPRETGGGVKDPNVKPNDPRTQFGPNGEKPLATKFYDFIVMVPPLNPEAPFESLAALSFKSSQLKVARELNALVMYRNAPIFAGRYRLSVVNEKNAKGEFFNFKIENAGWASSKEEYQLLDKAFEALKGKDVTFEREPGVDDEEPAAQATTQASTVGAENVPF